MEDATATHLQPGPRPPTVPRGDTGELIRFVGRQGAPEGREQPPVSALRLDVADELVERIAERAAELLAQRAGRAGGGRLAAGRGQDRRLHRQPALARLRARLGAAHPRPPRRLGADRASRGAGPVAAGRRWAATVRRRHDITRCREKAMRPTVLPL